MNRLLIFILFISTLSFSQEKKRLALVIGNSNYEFSPTLKNPINDAKLIANKLDSLGFDVQLHLDISSRSTFGELINEFVTNRNKQELGLIYYAGHAVQFNNKNYLLPTSVKVDFKSFGWEEKVIDVQKMINHVIDNAEAPTLLVLDACRDSPITDGSRGSGLTPGGLAQIEVSTGAVIAFSAKAGMKAYDGDGDNSLYALSFAKHMMTEDLNHNDLFRKIRGDFESIVDSGGDIQIPDYTMSQPEI